ncbi:hypothetical protein SAMN05444143_10166 [Flavobacterium succinicans]|uniref:Uncharacterized protein n=1 Tax=Flavobacterium succinicans TaxID=29536 RepID=A0A1I4QV29_9FLAO|nr:hypothetical protein SAMN05444143_10166 [Flavobacterium succinicans]
MGYKTPKKYYLQEYIGAHHPFLPHDSSRDPLYLCCRTPSAKDATPPGARRDESFS